MSIGLHDLKAGTEHSWNDENVQVYTIATSNKVTSKCRVIVPTGTVKRIIYECYLKHFGEEKYFV